MSNTNFDDWFTYFNVYESIPEPIQFHDHSQLGSVTDGLGFARPIITSFGQSSPIYPDAVGGDIWPIVASEPSPMEPSVAESATSEASPPPTSQEPSEEFVPMPPYGENDRGAWKARLTKGNPVSHYSIYFRPWGYTTKPIGGVPMNDCLLMHEMNMSDAHDAVFSFQTASQIIFRLMWPGYDNLQWTKHIPILTEYGPITRAQLAYCIADEFRQFFQACEAGLYDCSQVEWKVGQGRITFDRLKLASIWSPEDGVWIASVQVVLP